MTDLPEFVGPYKILDELGKGGFATVYLAHHKDSKEPQHIALKVPNLAGDYPRFRREAETVARLKHSNIIRIFDTADGEQTAAPFFTMEYIPGGTLRDKLEAVSCLSREEAVDIVRQIGAALTYAHEHGVIHRDVNPKNILLDERRKPTQSILTDFGLVKPLSSDENLTLTINLIGAFHYFSPEQWNKEELSPATDIYALAITFFEMLAGQRPFKGDIFALRDKHLREPPPLLSSIAPAVGPFFDGALAKAMAKNSAERYESVAQFIAALEAANDKADLVRARYADGLEAYAAGNPENIKQAMDVLTGTIKALAEMHAEHEKADLQERLRLLQVKAHYVDGIEAYVAGTPPNIKQAMDVLAGKINILAEMRAEREKADLQEKLRLLQVKAHYADGLEAYAAGNPENIKQAMDVLADKINILAEMHAEREKANLQEKLRLLQIKELHDTGLKAYVEAIPENMAEAIEVLEHNIHSLAELGANRESQDLEQKLKLLRAKERDDQSYKKIQALVDSQDYEQALARLDKEFIQAEKYEYQDVARLFWGLVYAKQHGGKLPPEWEQSAGKEVARPQEDNLDQKLEEQRKLNTFIVLSFVPASIISAIIGALIIAPSEVEQLRSALVVALVIIVLCWAACSIYYYVQIYRST